MAISRHLDERDVVALARLAAVQGGVVSTWQAKALGVSQDRVGRRQREEGWGAPVRAVASFPGVPDSVAGQLWAAALAVAHVTARRRASRDGDPKDLRRAVEGLVAVTAWSSADRRGYGRPTPAVPQLLVPHEVKTRHADIRVIRSRRGLAGHWEWLEDLPPIATPVRTVWDAAHVSVGLSGAIDSVVDLAVFFDRTRQLAIADLLLVVDEPVLVGLPRRPPPVLRKAADRLGGGFSHSRTEATARRIAEEVAAELGVRLHPSPYPIRDQRGAIVAEADIAAPALRFDAEVDGPHHRGPAAAAQHARRRARTDALDWVVCRYAVDERTDRLNEEWFRRQFRRDLRTVLELRSRTAA